MEKIVFLDRDTLGPNAHILPLHFKHQWQNFGKTQPDQIKERLKDASIAITNKVVLNAQILQTLPNLRLIVIAATGTDAVDIKAAKTLGITVCNIRDYSLPSAAEHTMALILGLKRNLIAYREEIQAGIWQQTKQFCFYNQPIFDLKGKTLGIIGTGAIALKVATMAKAFSMQCIFHSLSGRTELTHLNGTAIKKGEEAQDKETIKAGETGKDRETEKLVSLDTLLQTSDIISLHCPLTEKSHQLLDQAAFEKMKPTAVVINTARGDIIEIEALKAALDSGKIAAAGLDVVPEEPPATNSTVMQLAHYPNVIITPHTAWTSGEAITELCLQIQQVLESFVLGKSTSTVIRNQLTD